MKRALILIEYQNEWLDSSGKLNSLMQDRQQFEDSVVHSRTILAAARRSDVPVIHVTMTLEPSYSLFGKAEQGLRAAIPRAGTWLGRMAEIHPDFTPKAGEYVIRERAGASAFAGTTLDAYLRNNGIDTLYLAGYALHVCVESTFRQAHDLGYRVSVVDDASAAFTHQQRDYFRHEIAHHFGESITHDVFVACLENP